jgi:restriction system protein
LDAAFALLQTVGGELGFGKSQICVEVKSGSDPVDRPTVDKLIGAVKRFGVET